MYNEILKRKEKIIITAIDLLNEAGIHGLTTKEIARRQNITEPAIYKQFSGKKDIVMAILERSALFDDLIKNTMIDNKITGKAGILYFARAYAEYFQNYPQITIPMFSFDMFRYDADLQQKMQSIIAARVEILFCFVVEGVAIKEIPDTVDSQAITDALFGVIWSTTFIWQMGGRVFDLKDRVMRGVTSILN